MGEGIPKGCETVDCHRATVWVVTYPTEDDFRERAMCSPCKRSFIDGLARAPNEIGERRYEIPSAHTSK